VLDDANEIVPLNSSTYICCLHKLNIDLRFKNERRSIWIVRWMKKRPAFPIPIFKLFIVLELVSESTMLTKAHHKQVLMFLPLFASGFQFEFDFTLDFFSSQLLL
jgi:hypothetical protein